MIFSINTATSELTPLVSTWVPKELDLEKYILPVKRAEAPILNEAVFGEPLLVISNQVLTRAKKRADILALDRLGNGVIIELKRDQGALGTETQALQYLADFSAQQGSDFLERFSKGHSNLDENIRGFTGDTVRVEDINRRSRIILLARAFDPSLYSMGKWLGSHGVAFRCVTYTPVEIRGERYLSFSVAFDESPLAIFPLSFQSRAREPEYFWHNIGEASQDWWEYLIHAQQITASFTNQPADQGEQLLKSYVKGDTVIAYATRYGAVGVGYIETPQSYKLVPIGSKEDVKQGTHRHRLGIRWTVFTPKLCDGISASEARERFGIYHPVSTSARIDPAKAQQLIAEMERRFSPQAKVP